jgi:two-component system NtrC family response regulator
VVDFYQKPINLEELRTIIRRALYIQKLERENRSIHDLLGQKYALGTILGDSPPMREVFRLIETVANTDYTVLITGSSGTGKELAARAIHDKSNRRSRPFVAINCGAIPEELLETELFGHEKGAFTGAQFKKDGKFEVANRGTVFLDEIGDLSGKLQVKLLRFLQDHIIERVGSTKLIELDVRVLAATNSNLETAVADRRFREDLFYRLSVINIHLPDLKDREDDRQLLAEYFLRLFGEENNKRRLSFSARANSAMLAHSWPGNVRELENRIKRAVILSHGPKIEPDDLGLKKADLAAGGETLDLNAARERVERETIAKAMALAGGNVSKAAKLLGTSRTTLYYLLDKVGLNKPAD